MDTHTWSTESLDGTPIEVHTVGAGPAVIVLGGSVRTAEDYFPLADALAARCEVNVVNRRGRGGSGPQGPHYCIDREVEDLCAVSAATGARRVFGHSFGGLIALEAARVPGRFDDLVVYEPGVSVAGSIPIDWSAAFSERLRRGDHRGAFAAFVRGSGNVPPVVATLPLWYFRLILHLAIRGKAWARLVPVLPTIVPEHLEVARLDDHYPGYGAITARTLLLGGSRSPAVTTEMLHRLAHTLPRAKVRVLDGLDHLAPDQHAPGRVAEATSAFIAADERGVHA
jgi:pimeloyl-ACP methyl ester carboxylesterase